MQQGEPPTLFARGRFALPSTNSAQVPTADKIPLTRKLHRRRRHYAPSTGIQSAGKVLGEGARNWMSNSVVRGLHLLPPPSIGNRHCTVDEMLLLLQSLVYAPDSGHCHEHQLRCSPLSLRDSDLRHDPDESILRQECASSTVYRNMATLAVSQNWNGWAALYLPLSQCMLTPGMT